MQIFDREREIFRAGLRILKNTAASREPRRVLPEFPAGHVAAKDNVHPINPNIAPRQWLHQVSFIQRSAVQSDRPIREIGRVQINQG